MKFRKLPYLKGGTSTIIGPVLLLVLVIAVMTSLYYQVLSEPGPNPHTFVTIVGKLENDNVVFEHQKGESLNLDSKLIMRIAGRGIPITLDNYLDDSAQIDGMWNIGEKLVYILPDENLIGVQIDAMIIDKLSNSIVFKGLFQEGIVLSPFGRGGIWHFDETTGDIAYDSSGNNNHGNLRPSELYGPQWDIVNYRAGGCSLRFDGLNDYVEVKAAYSLNMTDAITVEAWIKPMIEPVVIQNKDYGESFAFNPHLMHVANDLYIAIGEGLVAQEGIIVTINISSDGTISDPIAESKYDNVWGERPDIVHVSGNDEFHIYGIAYRGKDGSLRPGFLKTFKIFVDNGSISEALDVWIFDDGKIDVPDIIQVSDNIYAIVYRDINDSGIIKTVEILNDGNITPDLDGDPIDEFTFNITAFGPKIINISDDVFAIAYRGLDNKGLIQTLQIDEDGQIITKLDEAFFDNVSDYEDPQVSDQQMKIIHINDSYYALVYANLSNHGLVSTVEIDTNGNIIRPVVIDSLDFDDDCMEPDIIHFSNDIYGIVYAKDRGHAPAYLISIKISPDGLIGESIVILSTSVEPPDKDDNCFSPEILRVSERVFVITYRSGVPHRGFLMTIRWGRNPTPPWERGIFKAGSITVYADAEAETVYAVINGPDQLLTLNCTAGLWHHIVLTYDRFDGKICLYCNNETRYVQGKDAYPELILGHTDLYINYNETFYSESICLNPYDLMFGHLFCGNLDEVAIFEYALTPEGVDTHFKNPGIFEGES